MKKAFVMVCASLGLVSAASAQTIDVDFDNVSPGLTLNLQYDGGNRNGSRTGVYNFDVNSGGVAGVTSFGAYCIELGQSPGGVYGIEELTDAPTPGLTGVAMMTFEQAVIVDALANFGLTSNFTSEKNAKHATIQALIWEAVHEVPSDVGTPPELLDLTDGRFQVRDTNNRGLDDLAVVFDGVLDNTGTAFEQQLFGVVNTAIAAGSNYKISTVALTSADDQDQVVLTGSVVPLPPAVFAALGVGAVLVPVARRRFTR